MVYKLLLYIFNSFSSFPKIVETGIYSEKEIINLIEKNKICQPSKKTFKIRKNFIGHFNEDGKPYGEWSLKDGSIRQCFLENGKSQIIRETIFINGIAIFC